MQASLGQCQASPGVWHDLIFFAARALGLGGHPKPKRSRILFRWGVFTSLLIYAGHRELAGTLLATGKGPITATKIERHHWRRRDSDSFCEL